MFSKSFFTLALFAAGAVAQTSTSTAVTPSGSVGGISPCILSCVQPAAQNNGCTFTDAPCVCASAQFQAEARACLQSKCTAADLQAALALQAAQCGAIGVSATGSATTAASGSSSGSSTRTSAPASTPTAPSSGSTSRPASSGSGTASAPASTSNAAMALGEGLGLAGAIVAGVVGLVL